MAFERISIQPDVCHGQACVKGTRIPVHQVVRMLANGDSYGRVLWGLGFASAYSADEHSRKAANALFQRVMPDCIKCG